MCYNLAEYDPFEPRYEMELDGSEYLADEPMSDEDWEEWLANEDHISTLQR